jgi:hypothetical protein
MSIAGALAKVLITGAGEVLLDVAKRAVGAAQTRLRPDPIAPPVPPPIGSDRYVAGMLDGIERERARQLEQRMAEHAHQRLDERSDEK